ncbi:MAG: hypothetical protein JSW47_16715 [Phycisphaerales bacterium]|nr:MAG: hypothetical protein JSW47_16715 [Phycisphaerales bacterium]
MKRKTPKRRIIVVLIASLALSACGGCGEQNSSGRLKLSPIYEQALWGAAIGGIIGYQSDEAGEGAALGAAIFGIGSLLEQTDKMTDKHREHEDENEQEQEVVIQIQNDNGSLTPVVLKKKGGTYVGPNGEHYNRLPTPEQLKPVYGL